MIKAAIFDLDSTLVDTETLKEHLFDFLSVCGFQGERAAAIYKSARKVDGKNNFTLDNFKEKLQIKCAEENADFSGIKWQKMVKKLHDGKNGLLIGGVKEVLWFLKEKKIPFYILTLGVPEWQKEKMRLAGLDKILIGGGNLDDCQNIKYTIHEDVKAGKVKEITKILNEVGSKSGEGIIFFNDKPDETKEIMTEFPLMKVFVRRERRDQRFSDKDFKELKKNLQVIQVSEKFDFLENIKGIS